MKRLIFKGSGVALITPFNFNGIDFDKLEELIEFHISNKTDAIISCGTTGEAATMTLEEKISVIKFTIAKVGKRIPVIVGAGSNNTAQAVLLSKKSEELGADAILSVTPYYNKASQNGLYEHFKTIANSVKIPIILYNVPGRTGVNIEPLTIKNLTEIDNIIAIKECNFSQVGEIRRLCGDDFSIYSGNDDQVLPMLAYGAKGVISVMANIIPTDTHNICQEFFDKNIEKSRELQLNTLELVDALFCEVSPGPIKEAMNILNMNVGNCRLPLVNMQKENIQKLRTALINYGILK